MRFAAHVEGEGMAFHEAATADRASRASSPSSAGRGTSPAGAAPAWLKIKIRPEQELVVGGWTPGSGNAQGPRRAWPSACTRTASCGSPARSAAASRAAIRRDLLDRLKPLVQDDPPFDPPPPKDYRGRWGGDLKDITWVRPELVIRAEIGGWTRDGDVRQTAYKGIEPGRDPKTVIRETAVTTTTAVRAAEAEVPPMPEAKPMPSNGRPREVEGASKSQVDAAASAGRLRVPRRHARGARRARCPRQGRRLAGRWQRAEADQPRQALFEPRPPDDQPITKRELIRYFATIAPTMLPHLNDRPLNLQRFPNGAGAPGFWQKNIPETAPKWLTRWHETGVDGRTDRDANDHLIADGPAALAWLGNQASFEIHAWTGKLPEPWQPTFAYIDIDPGEKTTWDETLTLARLYRAALEHLGVRGYPKTTGKRGIQIWIPIVHGKYDFHDTSDWVERVSRAVGSTVPDLISWEWARRPRARAGAARLHAEREHQDARRAVLRAAGGRRARCQTPITWDELDDPDLRPDRWTIRDLPARVEKVGDLFAAAQTDAQELPPV